MHINNLMSKNEMAIVVVCKQQVFQITSPLLFNKILNTYALIVIAFIKKNKNERHIYNLMS